MIPDHYDSRHKTPYPSSSARAKALATSGDSWFMEHLRAAIVDIPWKPILQRVPGIIIILMIIFALLGPIYTPWVFASYFLLLHGMFVANNLRTVYAVFVAYTHSKAHSMTDWYAKYCRETGAVDGSDTTHDLPFDQVAHIIVIPNYKETMDTLCETLDVLASHRRAITQYKICMAMEEAEQGSSEKAQELLRIYGPHFFEITYTIHPSGRPGEIRGKSSNVAWAARQMAMRGGPRHDHEVVTVMDADTGFAEDYFSALSYHYSVASPEQRRIIMFCPSTVFDRNAKSVPSFVRITDMFWSIGVISNLYPESPVKIPCSAYSVSMDLAISIGFWDTDPGSIGEDMHMYLKCFFSTSGRVIVKTIFSPASQCNIEGEGTGISGYFSGFVARYGQGKRHLWGTLDFGYAVRRTIMSYISPESQSMVRLKHAGISKFGKEEASSSTINLSLLLTLAHRLVECHILMGQFLSIVAITSITVPSGNSMYFPLSAFFWSFLTTVETVHPVVLFALNAGFWIRMASVMVNIPTFYYYEKYHQWVGFDRWNLQDRSEGLSGRRIDSAADLSYIPEGVFPGYDQPKVQYIGLRPQLASPRIYPQAVLDWIATPLSGLFFYAGPQYHAQLAHLFTDRLDYKVAAKPTLNRSSSACASLPLCTETSIPVAFTDVLVETSSAAAASATTAVATTTPTRTSPHPLSNSLQPLSTVLVPMHLKVPQSPTSSGHTLLSPRASVSSATSTATLIAAVSSAVAAGDNFNSYMPKYDDYEVKSTTTSSGDDEEVYFYEADNALSKSYVHTDHSHTHVSGHVSSAHTPAAALYV
ncbi:hypothetical protein BASA50_003966 [Batrachochytrium salamandrivorans]|uniref:Glycosyltransferase 2-like domain-containing protein n=1 Tax=Batrachochytrium salamandrivorans TaxID=1357716 RepID=A0ABQ8FH20_9FUNG|nr:hypothetical protein BASA61_005846 [Batrachochytrium salamandrivorans]KAH6598084.1 hypothetical protein BASA50_003966 [Batrachochytrium salamandrivorans]KAJ1340714.1 hypothetical protein BSLG_004808 [Batrachochytrium salamandrivorans]